MSNPTIFKRLEKARQLLDTALTEGQDGPLTRKRAEDMGTFVQEARILLEDIQPELDTIAFGGR